MSAPKSEPVIDLQSAAQEEQGRRTVPIAPADVTKEVDLQDTVRIAGTPRANPDHREVLKQPLAKDADIVG